MRCYNRDELTIALDDERSGRRRGLLPADGIGPPAHLAPARSLAMAVAVGVRPGLTALHPAPDLSRPGPRPSRRVDSVRPGPSGSLPGQHPSHFNRRNPGLTGPSPPSPAPVSTQIQPDSAPNTHKITAHNQVIGGIRLISKCREPLC